MSEDKENFSDESEQQGSNRDSKNKKKELGGPKGPEPTRYGDWEKNGRCHDF